MAVSHVEVLVEDVSTEAALFPLLTQVLGTVTFRIHAHQGKADLLARLPGRLRGYAAWLPADHRLIVVVDRDNDDCRELKRRLTEMGTAAGLSSRCQGCRPYRIVYRLAIEELEAWYFGDWMAVCAAYPHAPKNTPRQKAYRNPDAIRGGTWEAFERVMQRAGYFRTGLRKIEAARAIAQHWQPAVNGSGSFQRLYEVLQEVASA